MTHLNEKNIFLFDAIGAVLSASLTLIILPHFSELIGLPKEILYGLGVFPVVYGAYSFSCYLLIKKTKPLFLLAIIVANLIYCAISAALILFYGALSGAGKALLFLEILVILAVVGIEFKVYKKALLQKT